MGVPGIDFSRLDLCDALDLAILIEEEAEERYQELAHQMELHRTPAAADFFRQMAGNEAKHAAQLQERRQRLFGDRPRTVSRHLLWDVEAPEYDQARAFMAVRQAMQVALTCEEKAQAFFATTLPQVHDGDTRALWEELRDEEVQHQQMVRDEMAKLADAAPLDDEAFVDDPTTQ
jgi:rubrerythrin